MQEALRVNLSMRFSVSDWAIIRALSNRLGVESQSQLVRMGIRALCREQGLNLSDEDGTPIEAATPKKGKR
jgi:hypothetical protein